MTNSRKYAGIAFGLLGSIGFAVGGCSGDASLGGGSISVGGSNGVGGGAAGGKTSAGGLAGGGLVSTGGATGGELGAGGNACAIAECKRAIECVQTCDGPIVSTGCCACQNGTIDRVTACNGTGGNAGLGGATSGGAANGGSIAAGGMVTTGGSIATGGITTTGGSIATGGITTTGGSIASGGSSSTGGRSSAGGNSAATGGIVATGGSIATGGNATTGGSLASGGTSQVSTTVYDPCAGKSCGDTCTLCAPGNPVCVETAVMKSCDTRSQCVPGTVTCPIVTPPAKPPAGQRYLFEISNYNNAGAPINNGYYIDADGNAYQYGVGPSTYVPGYTNNYYPQMTETQVAGKYGSALRLVTQLTPDQLYAMYGLVAGAQGGTLLYGSNCADAGVTRHVAWTYDPASASYSPVLLSAYGDFSALNTAPQAQTLANLIDSTVGFNGQNLEAVQCGYKGELSSTRVDCSGSGVVCSTSGDVCALTKDSYVTCVPASYCPVVTDCGQCKSPEVCTVGDTAKYCTVPEPRSYVTPATCTSVGSKICAGGPTWCSGSQQAGFHCQAP